MALCFTARKLYKGVRCVWNLKRKNSERTFSYIISGLLFFFPVTLTSLFQKHWLHLMICINRQNVNITADGNLTPTLCKSSEIIAVLQLWHRVQPFCLVLMSGWSLTQKKKNLQNKNTSTCRPWTYRISTQSKSSIWTISGPFFT